MCMDLGDDATYSMKGLGSISLWMPSGDVLELNDVLFVLGLTKKHDRSKGSSIALYKFNRLKEVNAIWICSKYQRHTLTHLL
jgi:hypothetical protein